MNRTPILQDPKVIRGAISLNLLLWFLVIIPNIYIKGLSNSLVSLKSSSHCFFLCLFLFLSIALQYLYTMHKVQSCLLGATTLSERQFIFSNIIKENTGQQVILILISEPFRSSVECLIWCTVTLIYTWQKVGCLLITARLNENKLKNLEKFNFLILAQTLSLLFVNYLLFSKSGPWIFIMLNFDTLFVFKDTFLTYYQMNRTKSISGLNELKIEIIEVVFKLVQWIQVGYNNGSIISTNPFEFLVIVKLQSLFMSLITKCTQYSKFKSSISMFRLKYPPLQPSEIEQLADEKCCICWDFLTTGISCKITCGHILHIECIWKWMLRNTERKCPMCKQTFLEPEQNRGFSMFNLLSFLNRGRTNEEDMRRMSEIFPNMTEEELIREVERAGSVQQAIDNLLGE